MTPAWTKRGRVLATHAMLPTPVLLADRIRVFYAVCDETLRGRILFADLDRAPPYALMRRSKAPALDLGAPGAFDADGVNPSCLIVHDGVWRLYYIGWRRGPADTPYTLLTGLALSTDGEHFIRAGAEPILPPIPGERLFRTAPFVRPTSCGYEMLYIGGDEFFSGPGGKRLPIYALRHHASSDGVSWAGPSLTLLAPDANAGQIGFGRPYLWESSWSGPELMISIRTAAGYRLAHTPFGHYTLEAALAGPAAPWESDMTCFGAPLRVDDAELLFYNGNGMGRTGFGLATRPAHPQNTACSPRSTCAVPAASFA